jgi:hypothetical protein
VFKNLRNEITDEAKIDVISEEEWKNHYKERIVNEEETYQPDTTCVNEYNAINMTDLQTALRMSKNRKAPGIHETNMELIKYASIQLKKRFIQLLNDIRNVGKIPEEWKITRIVNVHKNETKENAQIIEGYLS